MKLAERMAESLKEHAIIAKCDHAFVMTPTQPKDPARKRLFCPRCEGTFTVSADVGLAQSRS